MFFKNSKPLWKHCLCNTIVVVVFFFYRALGTFINNYYTNTTTSKKRICRFYIQILESYTNDIKTQKHVIENKIKPTEKKRQNRKRKKAF